MTKQNKTLLIKIIFFFLVGVITYVFFGNYIFITTDFISNIVTFLSIIFGFYIASFSIFTTSKYVSQLYKIDDKENSGKQSLMDTLIQKYKAGLIITLLSIFYTLVIFFILKDNDFINLKQNIYLLGLLPIILLNFVYGFEMMNILVSVIRQTTKINQQ